MHGHRLQPARPHALPVMGSAPANAKLENPANRTSAMSQTETPPRLDPERHALFLDFDGTLVDFAPTPDAIVLRPGTVEKLDRLSRQLGGAMALISGRRVADLDAFLAPLAPPASGLHGLQIRSADMELKARPPSRQIAESRRRLAAEIGPGDRLRLEDKGGALVLHFREHPDQADRAKSLARQAIAGLEELHVVEGHAIAEIRARGVDKAEALLELMRSQPFSGRLPVYVGDDSTDEDGFRAAQQSGGFGIKVGAGETEATYRVADISAVHDWLAAAIQGDD